MAARVAACAAPGPRGARSVRRLAVGSAAHCPLASPDGRRPWLVVEGRGRQKERPGAPVFELPGVVLAGRVDRPLVDQDVIEGRHGNFSQGGALFSILNRGPGDRMQDTEVAAFDARTKKLATRVCARSTGVGTPTIRGTAATSSSPTMATTWCRFWRRAHCGGWPSGRSAWGVGGMSLLREGRYAYPSNAGDGNLHKLDMNTFAEVREIAAGRAAGASQVLNV